MGVPKRPFGEVKGALSFCHLAPAPSRPPPPGEEPKLAKFAQRSSPDVGVGGDFLSPVRGGSKLEKSDLSAPPDLAVKEGKKVGKER